MENSTEEPARILAVDDDAASCKMMEAILAKAGYAVRSVGSGEDALAAVAEQLPDLILLDLLLPGIDGFEVTRQLKADTRSRVVPIILVTMLEDRESRLKGLRAGADEFLSKPLDYTELLTRVKNQLKVKEYAHFLVEHNRILEQEVAARTAELLAEEQALHESEEKLRAIIEGSADGILLADAEIRQFTMGNAAICNMLGYSPDEIMRLGILDIHPQQDWAQVIEKFEKASTGESRFAANLPVKRKDGSVFYVDITASPVTFGGKKYMVGIFRDITERKLAEALLAEQLDELRRWHDATLGREMRSIELKREVNELLRQAGQPPRYPGVEAGAA